MYIGKWVDSGTAHNFDGYLAQYTCIDGLELGPSYFAYTDPLTNTWRPKRFYARGTTVNDGTVWSDSLTSTQNFNLAVTRAFDGNLSNLAATANATDANILFTKTFTNVKTLRVYMDHATSYRVRINGGSWHIDSSLGASSNASWRDLTSIIPANGTVNTIESDTGGLNNGVNWSAVEINGVILKDNTIQNLAFGNAGFYLPLDGNTPIGEDLSGNNNDWTPEGFGGSALPERATGAKPILNTVGGTLTRPGVFGSDVGNHYTILNTSGGGLYRFDGITETNPPLSFVRGATYIFDYSAATSHPLAFSTTDPDSSTTSYTGGVNTDTTNVNEDYCST